MQCMKAGIDMQIEEIAKSHPEKRVVLVVFNGSVTIIGNDRGYKNCIKIILGDGTWSEPIEVDANKFNDFGKLIEVGLKIPLEKIKPIRVCVTFNFFFTLLLNIYLNGNAYIGYQKIH